MKQKHLNFNIQEIRETGECDLTGKSGCEVIVYSLNDEPPCCVVASELLKLLRFESVKQKRRNGNETSWDDALDVSAAG